ncbi:ketopantoate reductase family protein [Sphingobium subterraneum]|uniref:2-dehydropantoate 2-reductase n=1 Tax=Sphingobium subterraneum TaxID=627688 RepID=A0A841J363_9SPHN|nr:2-dehydropantoate 2-reductase N-terminal domain-containing protein [Sphingobium subterraneum]MBB6122731.1 2-dehydropantoate 2-reductase [Sphingobium subterraneum]
MKILMFGRGAVASLYGWALETAGHEVDFYVRPGRIATLPSTLTLDIYDPRQKKPDRLVTGPWRSRLREDLPVDHDYDLIFISIHEHQFAEAASFLSTRAAHATIFVATNFWGDPQKAAAPLPQQQLAWGFPSAGGGINDAGVLRGGFLKAMTFGTFGTEPNERERAVRALFQDAGFTIKENRDFRAWLWTHFANHAGFSGQILRAGSMIKLMTDPHQAKEAILNIREAAKVLTARGVDVTKQGEYTPFRILPAWLLARLLPLAFRSNPSLGAMAAGHTRPDEILQFYYDFMANRLGVRLPRMEALQSPSSPAN